MRSSLATILFLWAVMAIQTHAAAPVITNITMYPGLLIKSDLGTINQIQYSTDVGHTNWMTLTNLVVTQTPFVFVDMDAQSAPKRFYRVLAFPTNTPPTEMSLIPAGDFTMGDSIGDGYSIELPVHTVYVSAFYMDKYEVTKALWDGVYSWATNHGYSFDNAGSGKAANHPVQTITWYDAVKWCNARAQQEGRTPAYYTDAAVTAVYKTGQASPYVRWNAGYRLPTEAEWEKAARGGAIGQRFPWGNTISWSQANYYAFALPAGGYAYDVNSTQGYHPTYNDGVSPFTSPVGSFAPNGYGLYDMAGNVVEWCWDWHGNYSSMGQTDPKGPTSSSYRVLRGGSWSDTASVSRVANRYSNFPSGRDDDLGFRSVLASGQ